MRRIQRRLALLLMVAVSAIGLTASAAVASEPTPDKFDIRDADTNEPCPALNVALTGSGGCEIHMESIEPIQVLFEELKCPIDFDLHISPKGWVSASNVEGDPQFGCKSSFGFEPGSNWFSESVDVWSGYLIPGEEGGYSIALWAKYDTGEAPGYMKEIHVFDIESSEPCAEDMTLTNSITEVDTTGPWVGWSDPFDGRILHHGKWQGDGNVVINEGAEGGCEPPPEVSYVEVKDAGTGEPCPDVSWGENGPDGGCELDLGPWPSTEDGIVEMFGTMSCVVEPGTVHIDQNGWAAISGDLVQDKPYTSCLADECDNGNPPSWDGVVLHSQSEGEILGFGACVDLGPSAGTHQESFVMDIGHDGGVGDTFTIENNNDGSGGPWGERAFFGGSWKAEAGQDVLITPVEG